MKGSPAVPPPRVPRTDGCPGLLVGPQRCAPGPAPCGGLWRRPGCVGAVSGWACGRSRCPLGGHTALRRWGDEGGAPGWKTGALSSCRWAGTPQEWAATAPLRWGCGIPVHTQPRPAAPSGGREVGGGRRTLSPELSCWTQRTAALPAAPEWVPTPAEATAGHGPRAPQTRGGGAGRMDPRPLRAAGCLAPTPPVPAPALRLLKPPGQGGQAQAPAACGPPGPPARLTGGRVYSPPPTPPAWQRPPPPSTDSVWSLISLFFCNKQHLLIKEKSSKQAGGGGLCLFLLGGVWAWF